MLEPPSKESLQLELVFFFFFNGHKFHTNQLLTVTYKYILIDPYK